MKEILSLLEKLWAIKTSFNNSGRYRNRSFIYFVLNKIRGAINVVVVKAPAFGDRKIMLLRRYCYILTGAIVIWRKSNEIRKYSYRRFRNSKKS